jgi:hypothetical protein
MRSVTTSLVALVLCTGASVAAAQTATPQTAVVCVQKPFQEIAHLDVTTTAAGSAHGTFSIRLPNTASKIQQISVRLATPTTTGGFLLLNLTATIRLHNVPIEHGVDVPNTPFLRSDGFPATMSRQVTFYADAGSVALLQADFTARPEDVTGVDVSIVGLTASDGCSVIQ